MFFGLSLTLSIFELSALYFVRSSILSHFNKENLQSTAQEQSSKLKVLSSFEVKLRLRCLAVISQRAFITNSIGSLEDPVLPGR